MNKEVLLQEQAHLQITFGKNEQMLRLIQENEELTKQLSEAQSASLTQADTSGEDTK